jgi:hypothetical protein
MAQNIDVNMSAQFFSQFSGFFRIAAVRAIACSGDASGPKWGRFTS